MFENHFALRENPFVSGHQPRFVFPSPEHQEALAHLRFGIENREPFVLITGEVGTGKTTALYDVLGEWKERVHVALINNSALTRSELLEEICLRLGFTLPPGSSKPQVLNQLERHLLAVHGRGERAILLFDEAQNLDRDLLEEIRLLSNLESQGDKLLQVFLVGQPELEERLSRPELRQLRQRISVHYRLKPMTLEDTERYIHHRVTVAGGYAPAIFPAESCRVVFDLSHGIPREINHICAQAMLGAFVGESPTVEPEHVRAAAAEIEFKSVMRYGAEEPAEPGPARIERRRVAPAPEPPRAVTSEPPATPAVPTPPIAGPPAAAPIAAAPVTSAAIAPAPVEARARPEPPAHAAPAEPPPARPAVPATPPSIARREPERFTPHTPPRPRSVEHRPPPFVPPTLRPSPSTVEDIEAENGSSKTLGWMLAIAALAVIAIAIVLAIRFGSREGKTHAAAPPPAPSVGADTTTTAHEPLAGTRDPSAAAREPEGSPHEAAAGPDGPPAPAAGMPAAGVASGTAARESTHATVPAAQHAAAAPESARVATTPRSGRTRHAGAAVGTAALAGEAAHATPGGAPKGAATQATGATKPPPANPASATPPRSPLMFGVAVGTYLDSGRAEAERTRLVGATKMPGLVRTVTAADSVSMYELVLGSYTSHADAERAASDLIARGVVDEARVVIQARANTPR